MMQQTHSPPQLHKPPPVLQSCGNPYDLPYHRAVLFSVSQHAFGGDKFIMLPSQLSVTDEIPEGAIMDQVSKKWCAAMKCTTSS